MLKAWLVTGHRHLAVHEIYKISILCRMQLHLSCALTTHRHFHDAVCLTKIICLTQNGQQYIYDMLMMVHNNTAPNCWLNFQKQLAEAEQA